MIWWSSSFILNLFNVIYLLFNLILWKENAVMNKVKETEGIVSVSMVTMQLPNASDLWESLQSMRRNKRCLPRIWKARLCFQVVIALTARKDDLKINDRMWRWLANRGKRSIQGVGTCIARYKHRNQKQLNFILFA